VINPGSPVETEIPAFSNRVPAREGDLIRVITAGGGGWGNPCDRDEARIREDVRSGKVSADGAMRQYGVVVSEEEDHSIDKSATVAMRQLMRGMQGKGSFFERGSRAVSTPSRGTRRTLKPKKVSYEKPKWPQIK